MSNSQLVYVFHVGQTAHGSQIYQLIFLDEHLNCEELDLMGWSETPASMAELQPPIDGVAKQLFIICPFEMFVTHKSNQNAMNDARDGIVALAWMATPDEDGQRLVLPFKMLYGDAIKKLKHFAVRIVEYI